ncbi:MAG: SDR family oxidoreductase [Anaerolineaceae bacterium]|jgi:dTDP-glucose 4,6-dehydratase|nr:SDR family oxidoreductase [Anaerolineaceae bacterium]
MRVLITGAAGFLGSHLCDRLIAEGHDVVGMDNFVTGNPENLAHLAGNQHFEFIRHDVSEYIFVPGKVDAVMHFASPASPNPESPYSYPNLPIQTMKAGALGTHNTLGVAKANQARFLLASTSEIYGDPTVHPQSESYWGHADPVGFRSVYDEAKRFAEALTMAYHRFHGLDTRIVRIFNTYGPRMRLDDGRVVPNFVKQALQKQPLTIYGDGLQTRSFCYVEDLIEGIYRLLMSDEHMPVNIGNPAEISILEFAKEINRLTDNPAGLEFHKDQRLGDDPQRRQPDITRAKSILKWQPSIDLATGLERTIQYFKGQNFAK